MPFKSEKQRRYLYKNEPELAKKWEAKYGSKIGGKASSGTSMAKKKQGYNDRLDESLGERDGKESTKKQSYKDRRDESEGMEKSMGKPKYSGNKSSNQGTSSKKKTKKKKSKKNLTETLAARQRAGK